MPRATPLNSAFALHVSGDLGGLTYVQKGAEFRTGYAKTYPKRTPTQGQLDQRQKFIDAQRDYFSLSPEHKQLLETIVTRKQMVMTGRNLWLSCSLKNTMCYIKDWAKEIGEEWPFE